MREEKRIKGRKEIQIHLKQFINHFFTRRKGENTIRSALLLHKK